MNLGKNISFFDLLCLNDENQLRNFLLANGKSPKPRCPITFIGQEEIDKISSNYLYK